MIRLDIEFVGDDYVAVTPVDTDSGVRGQVAISGPAGEVAAMLHIAAWDVHRARVRRGLTPDTPLEEMI